MRDNLIPEQRTDKHGHIITRWVKANPKDTSSTKLLPAPSLTVQPNMNYYAAIDQMLSYTATENGDYNDPFLRDAPESTLAYIYEALMAEGEPEMFAAEVSNLMNDRIEPHVMEAWIHLYDVHTGTMDDTREVEYLRGAIDSGSPYYAAGTYDRRNERRTAAVANLYRFMSETNNDDDFIECFMVRPDPHRQAKESRRLSNRYLADYIIENPERIDEIIRIAIDHPEQLRDRDSSGIDMVMEESRNWTPVSEGVL
jgi:hypothetical protein